MSDNSDYRPIPGQTPLTLPPKQETAPASPEAPATTPPPASATTAPAAPTPPLAKPISVAPAPAVKPVTAAPLTARPAVAPSIVKLPSSPKFVSPMPKIEETENETPVYLPVIAGIAAAAAITFSVLLYLKR